MIERIVICALFHDGDEKHVKDFIECHEKYRLPIILLRVEEDREATDKYEFVERLSVLTELYKYTTNNFDFSDAKNALLAIANADVVFFMDIDERITSHKDLINEACRRFEDDNIGALTIQVSSFYAYKPDKSVKFESQELIRVFRGNYRYRNSAHEQVLFDIMDDKKQIGQSRIIAEHYGYLDGNLTANKVLRNFRLLCKTIYDGFDNTVSEVNRQNYVVNMMQLTINDMHNFGIIRNDSLPK